MLSAHHNQISLLPRRPLFLGSLFYQNHTVPRSLSGPLSLLRVLVHIFDGTWPVYD